MELVTSDAQHARGLRAYAASAQGPNRTRNQDAFFLAPAHGLFVLADGIGGLKHGERASWALVRAFEEALPLTGDFAARVAEINAPAERANALLLEMGKTAAPPYVMGSTLLALLIDGADAACLWAGDSRLYLLHEHKLTQITQDHSHWGQVSHLEQPRSMLTRALSESPGSSEMICRMTSSVWTRWSRPRPRR